MFDVMFSSAPNIGCNVRLYSKHYMLQTLDAMFGRALDVMFGSAPNIRCIVAGSDGCGGSAANIPFAIIIISPTKTTTLPHILHDLYIFHILCIFTNLEIQDRWLRFPQCIWGPLYCKTLNYYSNVHSLVDWLRPRESIGFTLITSLNDHNVFLTSLKGCTLMDLGDQLKG